MPIRWFDQESLIYISGLNDIDAITGNDGMAYFNNLNPGNYYVREAPEGRQDQDKIKNWI